MWGEKKILKSFLILENVLITLVVFYFLFKLEKFIPNLISNFRNIIPIFIENIFLVILSLFSLVLMILLHIILWFEVFKINKEDKQLKEIIKIYFKVHTKRTFSPLGPISPILNIDSDLKKSTIIYIHYSLLIFLGSFLFFLIFLLYRFLIFLIAAFVVYVIILLVLKETIFKNIKFFEIFKLILISGLLEFISFAAFIYSVYIFKNNLDISTILLSYLIWVLISTISPFLYGTGAGESLATLFIYYSGYDPSLFLISTLYYRLLTTYLPILGLLIPKKYLEKNN
jgi:hypothetical protein